MPNKDKVTKKSASRSETGSAPVKSDTPSKTSPDTRKRSESRSDSGSSSHKR